MFAAASGSSWTNSESSSLGEGPLPSSPPIVAFHIGSRPDRSDAPPPATLHFSSRVLEATIIPADPFLSRRLQIQLGAEVVFLNRVRLMDGEPTAIERSYLPHELCPGILEYDFSTNSLYETLSTVYDKRPDHAEQVIEASLATPEVSQLLELTPPAVVFVFRRETKMASGQVVEYVDSELRADRFRFYTNLRLFATTEEFAFQRLPLKVAG